MVKGLSVMVFGISEVEFYFLDFLCIKINKLFLWYLLVWNNILYKDKNIISLKKKKRKES